MPPDDLILAFDTSGPHCGAVLLLGDVPVAEAFEEMARGQGERLMPMLEAVLADAGYAWSDLAAVAVGVGPGNFTGIRIGVSAARGLALALGVPAIPVTAFELARDPWGPAAIANELVLVAAPRDAAYAQAFRYGRPVGAAAVIDPGTPPLEYQAVNLSVTGHRAADAAQVLGGTATEPDDSVSLPRRLAKLAAWKWGQGLDCKVRPAPVYVRPADAAPPADAPPRIVP